MMNILAYVHLRNIHHSTGAGRVARELVEHVARREEANVHLLADRADYDIVTPKVGPPWTTLPCHLFSSDTSVQQAKWLMLHSPAAERFWPEVQIVHCTGESYVPTGRSRLVVTAHDAGYFDRGAHQRGLSTLKQSMKWRMLFATLSRTVDVFHTVSNFSAQRLGAAFPDIGSRIRVVYNAVTPLFFNPLDQSTEQILSRLNLKGRRYVLLPGGLSYRKNAELVLKAWPILRERVRDLTLVVASHSQKEYLAQAKNMSDSVVLTGFVEDNELRALYHGAQTVWIPSRYEGFGLPVLEAMACGAPVIASNTTSIPEIAGDAAVLVSPDSVHENVEAIVSVVNDGRLRANMRKQGKRHAASFTWAASAKKLCEIYAELL
jgi:glycosyltransferase involved in cell wall biosynthesis